MFMLSSRAGARFSQCAFHNLGCRGAPIIDGETGFLLKELLQGFENIGLHSAVDDHLAVLSRSFDEFGVLGVGALLRNNRVNKSICVMESQPRIGRFLVTTSAVANLNICRGETGA